MAHQPKKYRRMSIPPASPDIADAGWLWVAITAVVVAFLFFGQGL